MATGVLLRPHANHVPNPDETDSGGGAANPLAAFLSSLIPWREQRPPKQQLDHPAASATASAAAARRAAEAEAEARQLVGCAVPLFWPYVAQLPWHGGARAWLSKLFPRYGHYCGPVVALRLVWDAPDLATAVTGAIHSI